MQQFKPKQDNRAVAIWLMTGVAMIMVQVVLGGITRLTGSGLSITEWQPLLGTIPPLNEAQWQEAFRQYQQIGQYKQINFYFSLDDFKFIYFWEWFHRLWARLLAVAFLIPFIYFIVRRKFRRNMIFPMFLLFVLGGLQGAIGWIMVKSGLNQENLYVNHIRLAIHFMAALGLLCYTLWFALRLLVPGERRLLPRRFLNFSLGILGVLLLQLVYGAFMAGLKAAAMAPTWPTINGEWFPDTLRTDLFNDPLSVQFVHRGLAYLLALLITLWWYRIRRSGNWIQRPFYVHLPLLVVGVQVLLGIVTVVFSGNARALLWLGAAHQFTAMLLLLVWVTMIYLMGYRHQGAAQAN